MAQAIGYTMAAVVPIVIGYLHDVLQGWTVPLLLMIAISALQVWMGYLSGRQGTCGARENGGLRE